MKVLIISVHPDDETLGCGGTILKHRAAGDVVDWLVITQAQGPNWPRETIEQKAREINAVARTYGINLVRRLGHPAAQLDMVSQQMLIDGICQMVKDCHPEVIYLIHSGDVHTDHAAVFTASTSVLKPFYMLSLGVQRVLSYETLSSTEAAPPLCSRAFLPNVFVDITPYIDKKLDIMSLYASEIHADPNPRAPGAIRALARYRGATISVPYAEAFMLIREIIN
jgi:N-acetylglucosamine malate deacetylase 1